MYEARLNRGTYCATDPRWRAPQHKSLIGGSRRFPSASPAAGEENEDQSNLLKRLADPARFELTTSAFGGQRSFQAALLNRKARSRCANSPGACGRSEPDASTMSVIGITSSALGLQRRMWFDGWCGRRDSNPHSLFEKQIFVPPRLSPPPHWRSWSGLSLRHSLPTVGAARLVSTPSPGGAWLGISLVRTLSFPRL
jgi:hypothetical protein